MTRSAVVPALLALFLATACSTFSGEDTAPNDAGVGGADSGVSVDGASEAGPDAASGDITRIGATTYPYLDGASVTLAAVPKARAGDVLYAVVYGKIQGAAAFTAPPDWAVRADINDGEGRALALSHVVGETESATTYVFSLNASKTAGVLLAYRGVTRPPQDVVADASRNLTSNGKLTVPGFDLAERGRLVFVAVQTYDTPTSMTAGPDLTEVANAQRIGAYEKPVGIGATGPVTLTDPFAAAHSVLTFLMVLRPSS